MSKIIDKWADIADNGNKAMRDQVTSFEKSVSQATATAFSQFIDRVNDLHTNHDIDALEVLAYVLSPLLDSPGSKENITSNITSEGKGPLGGISRDQVISLCNKHGLRTLEQLLQLIDRLQQAQRGTLFKK